MPFLVLDNATFFPTEKVLVQTDLITAIYDDGDSCVIVFNAEHRVNIACTFSQLLTKLGVTP